MRPMSRNTPTPAALKAVIPAAILFLSVFHFSPSALNAQAFSQLIEAAPAVEVPYSPPPENSAVYTPAPGLNVYFLSVGQGDAIYIELPNGQNALIDGGPSKSTTSALAQFLAQKKAEKIDHVVLTHPHSDHYTGLQYVFATLPVGSFYDTRMDNTGATGDNTLRGRITELGVNTVYPAPGDLLSWGPGGVDAKVFNSCPEAVQSSKSGAINDCSIMIRLSYLGSSLLLTGDAQDDVEARLVERYGDELKAGVLKVGHHGSQYSSSDLFLNAVRPARAYIEVGKNNYGHPTRDTLNRLVNAGARVFRTDLDGTQEFSVAGSTGAVELSVE